MTLTSSLRRIAAITMLLFAFAATVKADEENTNYFCPMCSHWLFSINSSGTISIKSGAENIRYSGSCTDHLYIGGACRDCHIFFHFTIDPIPHDYGADHLCTRCGDEAPHVSYIAADGSEGKRYDGEYTELTSTTDISNITAGWYVARGTLSYDKSFRGTNNSRGDINIILCDGADMTITVGSGNIIGARPEQPLNIYGQREGTGRLTGIGNWGINTADNITINGGIISVTTESGALLSEEGNITINGGTVNATVNAANVTTSGGINARQGTIALGWRNAADRITASSFIGTVNIASGKAFTTDGTDIYSGSGVTGIDGLTLQPLTAYSLADNASNAEAIGKLNGVTDIDITLQGRTLFKDGGWNTIVLPFDVEVGSGQMSDATAMTLNSSTSGFNASTGELTLSFDNVPSGSTITAGTPFIVKWTGSDIVNPVFSNVTLSGTAAGSVTSDDGKVQFIGTYSPVGLTVNDQSNIFLGDANTLYWPNGANNADGKYYVNACRAYFHVDLGGSGVQAYRLNFGDATGISPEASPQPSPEGKGDWSSLLEEGTREADWYDFAGRRIDGIPTARGIYIKDGKKIIVK